MQGSRSPWFDVVIGLAQINRERPVVGKGLLELVVSEDVPVAPFRIVLDWSFRAHFAVPVERLESR